ncbi:MAG: hypothetical protein ABSD03_12395 [Vulcanimicrobiaceae bacterium]|jgi:hypothetical protein
MRPSDIKPNTNYVDLKGVVYRTGEIDGAGRAALVPWEIVRFEDEAPDGLKVGQTGSWSRSVFAGAAFSVADEQEQVERTITVEGREFTALVHPVPDGGFNAVVKTGRRKAIEAYGDTVEIALESVTEKLTAHAAELRDPIKEVFTTDVEVAGTAHVVTVTRRKSGRIQIKPEAFPLIEWDGDDEDAGLSAIATLIEAQTVNGERANVVQGGRRGEPLVEAPARTPEQWLCEITERQARVDAADRALRPYKRALKEAEADLEFIVRAAAEAGALIREPSLPLGAAV